MYGGPEVPNTYINCFLQKTKQKLVKIQVLLHEIFSLVTSLGTPYWIGSLFIFVAALIVCGTPTQQVAGDTPQRFWSVLTQ